jgi:hypothetical protein
MMTPPLPFFITRRDVFRQLKLIFVRTQSPKIDTV